MSKALVIIKRARITGLLTNVEWKDAFPFLPQTGSHSGTRGIYLMYSLELQNEFPVRKHWTRSKKYVKIE